MAEILAPCGSPEVLKAALRAGCDAVYLGGEEFSARQNAANFCNADIEEAVYQCHKRGVKVYRTINTVIFDDQLDECMKAVKHCAAAGVDGIITLPHLGASTPEAEDNCAAMAAKELMDYLENGNIVNSVNYPNCSSPRIAGKDRICILHKDVPAIIGAATGALGEKGINISHMTNNSKGEYAYTILDTAPVDDATVEKIKGINNVISVRVLKYN